jgi:hypothetical protein
MMLLVMLVDRHDVCKELHCKVLTTPQFTWQHIKHSPSKQSWKTQAEEEILKTWLGSLSCNTSFCCLCSGSLIPSENNNTSHLDKSLHLCTVNPKVRCDWHISILLLLRKERSHYWKRKIPCTEGKSPVANEKWRKP